MDYLTKPATREQLREFASIFRELFEIPLTGRFPVLEVLEKFQSKFSAFHYEVVEDDELPISIPAQCEVTGDGSFEMKIRQSIYDGAYKKGIGAYRDHILHELCHVFLYSIGFTPVIQRSFRNGTIPNYCSSEWQAKALCGEIMIPYEESNDLTAEEIQKEYGVSKAQAEYRKIFIE